VTPAKPAPPVETEAKGDDGPVVLQWEGLEIPVPATMDDWDPDLLEVLEQGKAVSFLRALFGSAAYERIRAGFRAKHGRKPTVGDLGRLAEIIANHYGFESVPE
jgi:hypothetical protein